MKYKRPLVRKFYDAYIESSGTLTAFSLYAAAALILFRITNISIARASLHELSDFSAMKLFLLSGPDDALTGLTVLSILAILVISTAWTKPVKIILPALFLTVYIFALLFFTNFFMVYESPFHPDFITAETATGPAEFFSSAVAETALSNVAAGVIAYILLFMLCRFLIRYQRKSSPGGFAVPESFSIPALPVIAGILVMHGFISLASFTAAAGPDPQRRARLEELSANPFINLFRSGQDGQISAPEAGYGKSDAAADSLENPRSVNLKGILRPGSYNIVFYFFESTAESYTDIKIDGREVMPVFNRLAANSIRMKRHYANYPLSANAMFSIFSSKYAPFARDLAIQRYPGVTVKSISEILKEKGYTSCLIHTGGLEYSGQDRYLETRNFDKIIQYRDMMRTPPYNKKVGWGLDERSMIKPAVDFIKNSGKNPWFISLHPVNPHHPYAVPSGYKGVAEPVRRGDDAKTAMWKQYLNSLHYADFALGEIINAVESAAAGSDRKTLFFIFADHGEAFYQHPGNYNHPLYIYEENIHVPFIIYSSEVIRKPVEVTTITRHIDIMPTVLSLLSIDIPEGSAGLPVFSRRREQLAFIHTYWKDEFFAIADINWKYIIKTKNGFEELYNLADDPGEKNNLIKTNKETAALYRKQVEALKSKYTAENRSIFTEKAKRGGAKR
jgi:arylsulfatase A-like enzyme